MVFLSTNDQLGGAAIVTLRLVEALRSAGVDARMVVGRKDGTDDYVAQVGQTRRKVAKVLERGEVFINNGFDMGDLWKVSTGSFGADVCGHPWVRDADVIVLGWINQGFLSLPQLKKLCHTGKPVFWWMHDLWCATGICHLPGECQRFTTGCGQCPFLHQRKSAKDLSHRVWKRKKQLFSQLPVQFIAVSHWQRDIAYKSPLLQGKDIEVLPHAFPVEEYRVKPDADMLPEKIRGIIAGNPRKLIAMGAARLDDPVKDLPMAIESLNTFVMRHPEMAAQCEAVFFGGVRNPDAFNVIKMPWRYLGELHGNDLRQLYAAASVVLSTSKFETMGATLMEGMAAGAIPVTFGRGGQTDIVTPGENGFVADYGSPESVAECLAKALSAPLSFSRQSQHNSVAGRFSASAVADRFMAIVNQP